MRIRTWVTFSTGAAVGAGAMYLLDPEAGPARRRAARQEALRQARSGTAVAVIEARERAAEVATAALAGYREARRTGSTTEVAR